MSRRFALALGAAIASGSLVSAAFAGCSLGLDESLIDAGVDGTGGADVVEEGAPPPPADGSRPTDAPVEASGCSTNADCTSPDACHVGQCDATKHCTFTLCPVAACQGSTCDPVLHACTMAKGYGYHAGRLAIAARVGCGGAQSHCFVASYPFVFVGTDSGVLAYAVSDPTAAPKPTPITGLPFLPVYIVGSGTRVWFLGPVLGNSGATRMTVAWLDTPSDPMVASLAATTVFLSYPQGSVTWAFAGPSQALFVEFDQKMPPDPVARLSAPLTEPGSITLNPSSGLPSNAEYVGASGPRLVAFRWDPLVAEAWFSLENAAGALTATNGGEQNVQTVLGTTSSDSAFASGPDGTFLYTTTTYDQPNGAVSAVRFAWLLNDQNATAFNATQNLALEAYMPEATASPLTTAGAWLDANTALVLAAAAENTAQTSVQVASRAQSPPALLPTLRTVLGVGVGAVASAASGGFGYVLTVDSASAMSVHVFAPTCKETDF